jgi:hypothetical protein
MYCFFLVLLIITIEIYKLYVSITKDKAVQKYKSPLEKISLFVKINCTLQSKSTSITKTISDLAAKIP